MTGLPRGNIALNFIYSWDAKIASAVSFYRELLETKS